MMTVLLCICIEGRNEITEPVGARDFSIFRLVDMFTACTPPDIKKHILHSFCSVEGVLRVGVATVAFGMGINCPLKYSQNYSLGSTI